MASKNIIAFGDSTTWGYNRGNQVKNNMVSSAQDNLGEGYTISNKGINSTTIGDLLGTSSFKDALDSDAGIVILNYGMNEAYRGVDTAQFEKELSEAVRQLQASGKHVILQTPNATTSTDDWASGVNTYADVIRRVSEKSNATLHDKYLMTSGLENATSAEDPVHPTEQVYGLLGNELADIIKNVETTQPETFSTAQSNQIQQSTQKTSVEDLYREVLGREPDPEGLAFWKDGFGSEVSPEERASFIRSAQPEIQSRNITQFATPTLTPDQLQARAQKAYDDYSNVLRNGEVTADTIRQAYGEHDPGHVQRVLNIKAELDAQQAAGSKEYYSAGRISAENATWDMAFRLAETGVSSVQDMGKKTVSVNNYDEGAQWTTQETQYYNKATGEDLTDEWNRLSQGGGVRTNYNLHFTDDGMVMPYTTRESSSWVNFRDSTLKPIAGIALAAYGVPYVAGALAGTTIGGVTLAKGSAALAAASSASVAGGVSLLAGNSFEDSLKSALVSGLTAGASAGYADKIGQSLGFDAGSIASKAAGNAVVAAVKAGVTDENVLESMVTAALTTAMTAQNDFDATEREGSLAKPSFDDSELNTDFSVGADYTLGSNLKFPSLEGIRVDDMEFGDNYDLTAGTIPFETGLRDTLPNLTAMGGGQGITIRRDDGTILSGQDFTSGSLMNEDGEDFTTKSLDAGDNNVGSTTSDQNNFEMAETEKLLDTNVNNNYDFKADYDLSSNLKFDGVGLKVDDVQDAGLNVGYETVDYGIDNITGGGGLGLTTGSSSNLDTMGGGQGITVGRDDGTTLSGVNDAGLNLKDVKTIAKIGGVLLAGDKVIDKTIRPNTSLGAKREDPWRNAPIEGFRMAKFEDPVTGKFKYVPFVKNNALLPPPSGYKEIDYYAKGGFVTKRN